MIGAFAGWIIRSCLYTGGLSRYLGYEPKITDGGNGLAKRGATLVTARSTRWNAISEALAEVPRTQRYLWLAAQAEQASPAEMRRLFRLAGTENQIDLQRAIAARWAKLDPSHMFQSLQAEPGLNYRCSRILFAHWVESDPDEAVEQILAAKKDKRYREWASGLWHDLMKKAPETAILAYNRLDVRGLTIDQRSIREWAEKDPASAAAVVVDNIPSIHGGWRALEEIGKAWGQADPETALSFAIDLKDPNNRAALLTNAMTEWAQHDPEAAVAYASEQQDPNLRAWLGSSLVAGLAETDPVSALAWANDNLQSRDRAYAISEAIETIAKKDVQAAAEAVASIEPGGAMNFAVSKVVGEWSDKGIVDNVEMWSWIASLSDTEARERAVQGLEWRLATDTQNGLVDLVSGPHGYLATAAMVERAARQKARQDPESAAAWARELPEDRSDKALKAVMNLWRSISPNEAIAWETANR